MAKYLVSAFLCCKMLSSCNVILNGMYSIQYYSNVIY